MRIAFASLAVVNLAGLLGLGWFAATVLFYDGMMGEELLICTVPGVLLIGLTIGAFALERRGLRKSALALLAVGAVPTMAVFGFVLYLEANPIVWR